MEKVCKIVRRGPMAYLSGEHAGNHLVDSDAYTRMGAVIAAARTHNRLLLEIALAHFDKFGGEMPLVE